MDRLVSGSVLLVGEGDFSFSVAMVSRLPPTSHSLIVSSSLETEDSIQKHGDAQSNIDWLRNKGITVHLRTDATQIHHQMPEGQKFARIIFNFPHIGGKSNIKNNRKLLNDFFCSAGQILEDRGQIMVTLCKGQGGTPADEPIRAWHDSWQVVSMAANAGLILSEVVPFLTEDYPQYRCRGFRSQDKGFHTENAITHIFEKAKAVVMPTLSTDIQCTYINGYYCPEYLLYRINRELHNQPGHPLHWLDQHLKMKLFEHFEGDVSMENRGPVVNGIIPGYRLLNESLNQQSGTSEFDEDDHRVKFNESDSCSSNFAEGSTWQEVCHLTNEKMYYKLDRAPEYSSAHPTNDENQSCGQSVSPSLPDIKSMNLETGGHTQDVKGTLSHNYGPHLCCSVLEDVPNLIDQSDKMTGILLLCTKTVIRRISIVNNDLPVSHSMVGILKTTGGDFSQSDTFAKNSSASSEIEKLIQTLCLTFKTLKFDFKRVPLIVVESNNNPGVAMQLFGRIVVRSKCTEDINIGEIYKCSKNRSNSQIYTSNHIVFTLQLDQLAVQLFYISNIRLLWSTDDRFLQQFEKQPGDTFRYRSFSCFPMQFTHDMSFWENEGRTFDMAEFCDIIRGMVGDIVTSVSLVDRYLDRHSDKWSRCYRFVYLSHDMALSYDTSWKIQSMLRLEIAKQMEIHLR